jgi:hypothetical protein
MNSWTLFRTGFLDLVVPSVTTKEPEEHMTVMPFAIAVSSSLLEVHILPILVIPVEGQLPTDSKVEATQHVIWMDLGLLLHPQQPPLPTLINEIPMRFMLPCLVLFLITFLRLSKYYLLRYRHTITPEDVFLPQKHRRLHSIGSFLDKLMGWLTLIGLGRVVRMVLTKSMEL